MLSNDGICIWDLSARWVPYIIGSQKQLMVAMDWTSFANDKQLTLCLNVITSTRCATPLLWKTIDEKQLKHNRARYEDQMLSRLKDVLALGVEVTIVADRGFADKKFFKFISEELGFKYIIRIKSNTFVTDIYGEIRKAAEWLDKAGRVYALKNAKITKENYEISRVAIGKEKGMKDIWILASNTELVPREIINCYAKRWKIEPYFWDVKDGRFGYGLRSTHIKASGRRDQLFLIVAMCYLLLTLLGQAGESIGFDKKLKVNTVKTRTHSLFRQGKFYYDWFHHFSEEERNFLLIAFEKVLQNHDFWVDFFRPQK